jgi:hypothetical protein
MAVYMVQTCFVRTVRPCRREIAERGEREDRMRTAEPFTILGKALCSVVLVLVVATPRAAQEEPDFSGRWILESPSPPAPDTPRALSVRQSLVRTNVRGEAMKPFFNDITIDREFESGTRSETHQIGVVGGVVPGFREDGSPDGPRRHHAVKWDGNALLFESGSYTGQAPETGVWDERREVWSLDPNGRLRLAITTRSSVDGSRTVTLVYRRLDVFQPRASGNMNAEC